MSKQPSIPELSKTQTEIIEEKEDDLELENREEIFENREDIFENLKKNVIPDEIQKDSLTRIDVTVLNNTQSISNNIRVKDQDYEKTQKSISYIMYVLMAKTYSQKVFKSNDNQLNGLLNDMNDTVNSLDLLDRD
jgi:hypothetical protein